MQIVILGAGQVGRSLVDSLISEQHSITLVDVDTQRLNTLQNRYDIRTVAGYCSHPHILAEAGTENADLLLAVTNNDEVNMIACQIAHTLFRVPQKIARIRAQDYLSHRNLFGDHSLPIDVFFSPELLVSEHIENLISYPGAMQVLDFITHQVKLITIKITASSEFLNKSIETIQAFATNLETHCVGIFRQHHWLKNNGLTIELHDELYWITTDSNIPKIMAACGHFERTHQRIMLAGGGNIGAYLAKSTQNKYQVKVIEYNPQRCGYLSQQLHHTTVLQGDACDTVLLKEENIETMDLFCALTNDDENNIISCLQAKQLGAKQTIALVVNPAYLNLIDSGLLAIDLAISPQLATADSIFTQIRQGNMAQVHVLHHGAGQACELIVRDSLRASKLAGKSLQQLNWPAGILIGVIVRNQRIFLPHPDLIIDIDDHIIIIVTEKNLLRYLENLV